MHPAACVSACVRVCGGASCRAVTQSEAGVSRNVWLLWEPVDERVNREVSYGERETRGGEGRVGVWVCGGCQYRNGQMMSVIQGVYGRKPDGELSSRDSTSRSNDGEINVFT